MKYLMIILLILPLTFNGFSQKIDSKNSIVNFKVPKADGTISGMTGTIKFDAENLNNSSFNVSIDPNTINTDNKKRDEHLKTDDFFNVELFPKITFESTSVSKTENGYVTEGKMKLHGVTQTVKISFTVEETSKGMTFTGNLSVNQLDYEMSKKDKLVDIEIICVLTK